MKKIICLIFALLIIGTVNVCAEDDSYTKNYNEFGANKVTEILDENTKSVLDKNGINPEDKNFINNLKVQNIFSYIISLLKGGFKKPFGVLLSVVCLIGVMSAFNCALDNAKERYTVTVACCAVVLITVKDLWGSVTAAVDVIKMAASFMIGFIPVFIGLTAAEGKAISAAGMGAVMLFSANAVSSVAAFFILPVLGGHLSLSMAGSVSPLIEDSGLADMLKRISLWVLSLTTSIFLGVLSIQNVVNSSADNVALKTAKFILGTGVPVAGQAISEAMSGVVASLSFLRTTIGIYAVIALAVMFIPVLLDILLWRFVLNVSSGIASLFSQRKMSSLLKAIDGTLACLTGILFLCSALFIISLTVVLK